jgi:hypothetical protein
MRRHLRARHVRSPRGSGEAAARSGPITGEDMQSMVRERHAARRGAGQVAQECGALSLSAPTIAVGPRYRKLFHWFREKARAPNLPALIILAGRTRNLVLGSKPINLETR